MTEPPDLPRHTERLTLRHYRPEDLEATLDYFSDPGVARYLLHGPWTREDANVQIRKRVDRRHIDGAGGALALVVEHSGHVIGDVGLWPAAEGTDPGTTQALSAGEAGWVFHPSYGGRGFATEAVHALLGLAFDHYRMHRVQAQMDARNTASARMCERLGMTREGHLRQNWWCKGEWTDTAIYSVLASEWPQAR